LKQINLIQTPITNTQAPEGFILDYRGELLRIVEVIPEGATASQMGAAISIAKKLQDAPGGVLVLENSEWEYLKAKVSAARFIFAAPEIVAMVVAVENAAEA
jgi:hypothetical protein